MENQIWTETVAGWGAGTPQGSEADSLDDVARDAAGQEADDRDVARDVANPDVANRNVANRDIADLILRAQAGEHRALNSLLAYARPRLLAVAIRIVRDRDDAEDVAQESLLKVCRYLTRFEARSAFTTWLHRIVVNTSLDRLRRPQQRLERTGQNRAGDRESDGAGEARLEPPESISHDTPERALAQAEVGAAVQGAIARLSPVHRQAIALRELNGESYQAIADIARCPVGTVMSRLHHARHRLAVELSPAFGDAAMQAA
jgi:RNA polymerase sigma-70 factor (ECF subfamily)